MAAAERGWGGGAWQGRSGDGGGGGGGGRRGHRGGAGWRGVERAVERAGCPAAGLGDSLVHRRPCSTQCRHAKNVHQPSEGLACPAAAIAPPRPPPGPHRMARAVEALEAVTGDSATVWKWRESLLVLEELNGLGKGPSVHSSSSRALSAPCWPALARAAKMKGPICSV